MVTNTSSAPTFNEGPYVLSKSNATIGITRTGDRPRQGLTLCTDELERTVVVLGQGKEGHRTGPHLKLRGYTKALLTMIEAQTSQFGFFVTDQDVTRTIVTNENQIVVKSTGCSSAKEPRRQSHAMNIDTQVFISSPAWESWPVSKEHNHAGNHRS